MRLTRDDSTGSWRNAKNFSDAWLTHRTVQVSTETHTEITEPTDAHGNK